MTFERAIYELLEGYRCSGWVYEDGSGMSLLDVLSSPMSDIGTVGTEELRLLAEHLAEELEAYPVAMDSELNVACDTQPTKRGS